MPTEGSSPSNKLFITLKRKDDRFTWAYRLFLNNLNLWFVCYKSNPSSNLNWMSKDNLTYGNRHIILVSTIQDFLLVNKINFLIGNCNIAHKVSIILRIGSCNLQISSYKQKTIYAIRIFPYFWINYTRIHISCNFYLEIVNVMRNFFSGALKNNSHLAFGFLTGILRVAKESILTIDWKQRDYWGNYRIGHTGNHRRIL